MSLLKKLAGLAVGAAAVGAVAYVLQNREHHDDEYEHIWGPEDEVEPETDSAEPAAKSPKKSEAKVGRNDPCPPLTMRPPRLNPPPLPHLRNLPPPPRSRSPKNPRTLLKRPPLRLPTLTPPT